MHKPLTFVLLEDGILQVLIFWNNKIDKFFTSKIQQKLPAVDKISGMIKKYWLENCVSELSIHSLFNDFLSNAYKKCLALLWHGLGGVNLLFDTVNQNRFIWSLVLPQNRKLFSPTVHEQLSSVILVLVLKKVLLPFPKVCINRQKLTWGNWIFLQFLFAELHYGWGYIFLQWQQL